MPRVIWERHVFGEELSQARLTALGEAIKSAVHPTAEVKLYNVRAGETDKVIRDCVSVLVSDRRQVLIERPVGKTFIDVEVVGSFAEFLRVHDVVLSMGAKPGVSRHRWIMRQTARILRHAVVLTLMIGILVACGYLIWWKGFWMAVALAAVALALASVAVWLFSRALKHMK